MLVSVLIANYNNSPFLEQCILSAINQSYTNIEIIICDDFSTDNSLKILEKFEDQVLILKNEKNFGVGYTKYRLIERSSGKYFLFLDSDDYLVQNCVEDLMSQLFKFNNVSMVYAQSTYLNLKNELVNWGRSIPIKTNLLDEKFDYPVFAPVLYSREHYNLTIGINKFHRSAVDFDLWYKMEEVGRIVFLNKSLYVVRENKNGVSQALNSDIKWIGIMLEHAVISAHAAYRRDKDVRIELDSFAREIFIKLKKEVWYVRILKKLILFVK